MSEVKTVEEFKKLVENTQAQNGYKNPIAFGICRVDCGQLNSDKILQATYPIINWNENFGSAAVFVNALSEAGEEYDASKSELVCCANEAFVRASYNSFAPYINEATGDAHKNVQVIKTMMAQIESESFDENSFKVVFIFEDEALASVEAAYLKLYALSQSKVALRSVNLNGAFGALSNCAWSNGKPIELDWLRANEIELKMYGEYPHIDFVDKFPRLLQHVILADNTRILDTSKVRFGAQLHAGTTVMPGASYINFNAGTTGVSMVEGRISSSAIVGDGSDVGGGASILGVLSGTNGNPISIGKNSLLGANSVCGIPLGDGCIIDAGLSILEGTKVSVPATEIEKIQEVNEGLDLSADATSTKEYDIVVKGLKFSSLNGVHFRQNSQTGEITAYRSQREIKLNEDLH